MIRKFIEELKYRRDRKKQAERAASLAVQLVLNGCLAPSSLTGAKGRGIAKLTVEPCKVYIPHGGVA